LRQMGAVRAEDYKFSGNPNADQRGLRERQ
jgi:hypothetical protein